MNPLPGSTSLPPEAADHGACAGSESFALMVLGESMAPEFLDQDIVVIEPDGLVRDGSFVLARVDGDWALRRLNGDALSGWTLQSLHPTVQSTPIPDLQSVKGTVIRRVRGGRRRDARNYLD